MTTAASPARRPFVRMRPQRDRWVIAYADMITLLLACFASLYAASLEPKLRPSGEGILPGAGPRVITGRATTDGVAHLMPALERLVHQHDESTAVDLAADARGIVISLNESGIVCRREGSADRVRRADAARDRCAARRRPEHGARRRAHRQRARSSGGVSIELGSVDLRARRASCSC